jgi:hypothetical protein
LRILSLRNTLLVSYPVSPDFLTEERRNFSKKAIQSTMKINREKGDLDKGEREMPIRQERLILRLPRTSWFSAEYHSVDMTRVPS